MNSDASGTRVFLILWKAWRAMSAHDERSIRTMLGFCQTDFAVLEVLLSKGPLPVNTIGRKVLLSSGSITTAVDRLEQRGLVERRATGDDRRVNLVVLTRTGRTTIEKAYEKHAAVLEAATAGLTRAERLQLIDLLKKLGLAAEASLAPAPRS